jgi:hypothetical protein
MKLTEYKQRLDEVGIMGLVKESLGKKDLQPTEVPGHVVSYVKGTVDRSMEGILEIGANYFVEALVKRGFVINNYPLALTDKQKKLGGGTNE